MGFYSDRTAYWRSLAEAHTALQHGPTRTAFIRNVDDEMNAELFAKCHKKVLVYEGLSGRYEQSNDDPERILQTVLHFLVKAASIKASDVEAAKDEAYTIMEDFVARIMADANGEIGNCPVMMDIDNITFNESPEAFNNFFGWTLVINEKPTAHLVELDESRWTDSDNW
jgi:hypothetical protein